ncbi:MAG: phosphopantetheine-binding protein [Candidatus Margulisbacteria bacterium]|jgi:acyl carrier protein|nr:phosphopantetheine-binding protein [Candidatus Margulisiibacteriota bacterium]
MRKIELETEIKQLIVDSLELEDISPADIEPAAPLFGAGLGLDSIDALELGMALKKKYDVNFKSTGEENKQYFASVQGLVNFIAAAKNLTLED